MEKVSEIEVVTLKGLFESENINGKFQELLGQNKASFVSSVIQTVNGNSLLKKSDPMSVIMAASTAAVLGLPVNQDLGFAYIVPYNKSVKEANGQWTKKSYAQLQIGWKGFIQLAQRTNQYKRINAVEVYENQFNSYDKLTEFLDADFTVKGEGPVVGYAGYFELTEGFIKTVYWTDAEIMAHGLKYSKSFNNGTSAWKTNKVAMCLKTVIKNMLSKYGPLSIETQTAIQADQSVQTEEGVFEYVDNEKMLEVANDNEEAKRIKLFISNTEDLEGLEMIVETLNENQVKAFESEIDGKKKELLTLKKSA